MIHQLHELSILLIQFHHFIALSHPIHKFNSLVGLLLHATRVDVLLNLSLFLFLPFLLLWVCFLPSICSLVDSPHLRHVGLNKSSTTDRCFSVPNA